MIHSIRLPEKSAAGAGVATVPRVSAKPANASVAPLEADPKVVE
jgi:hypothetical protein